MALRRADQDYETSQSIPRQLGGTDLVGQPNDQMEWQDSISNGARPDNRIRRFIPRLGSVLPRHQHLEKKWHINCLELLAATLALKTFVKNTKGLLVLLKIDNTTAAAYINNQGGTISKDLIVLTRDLWMWCLERNIHIQAQYLPGVMNQVADMESRSMKDRSDWKLDRSVFLKINKRYGPD